MIRAELLDDALKKACILMGLQQDVEIVGVDKGFRVTLHYHQNPAYPDFADNMIRLERWLKKELGLKELDLLLEPLEDKNKRDLRTGRLDKVVKLVSGRNVESLD